MSNDISILGELSSQTLKINTDNISDICSRWSNNVLQEDLGSINLESVFKPLTTVGVATTYIPSLKKNLENIENMILSASNYVKQTAEIQKSVDIKSNNKDRQYNGDTSNGRNSGSVYSSENRNNYGGAFAIENPTVSSTTVDNTQKNLNINTQTTLDNSAIMDYINNIPYDSYIKIMTALSNISNGKLSEYLTKEEYASELKKIILESLESTDEIREIIMNMDPKILQKYIQNMTADKNNVSYLSRTIIDEYTESEKEKTNLIDIAKSYSFYDDLDVISDEFASILEDDDKISLLKEIYDDGKEGLSQKTSDFVKTAIDNIASSNKMTHDQLLSGGNENMVKSEMESISKSLAFLKTVSKLDSTTSSEIYNSIIGR